MKKENNIDKKEIKATQTERYFEEKISQEKKDIIGSLFKKRAAEIKELAKY